MKKLFFFAVAAAMMASCSQTEELSYNQPEAKQDGTVNFDVYTMRTRAGIPGWANGTDGITTLSLQTASLHGAAGFGVFAYYTEDSEFDPTASKPNFMYNQQVKYDGTNWVYEPVKYWPNEFGDAAVSDDFDHVSFFAYAPWVDVKVDNGIPVLTDEEKADKAKSDSVQNKNITQLSKNTATGDPIVKYVVDTNPESSVDLLWGVCGEKFSGMWDKSGAPTSTCEPGNCFIDLTKQVKADSKMKWNFKHALAKLNIQIRTLVDDTVGGDKQLIPIGAEPDALTTKDSTKVYLRSIKIGGFVMKGALNLHSEDAASVELAKPNWKDYDGVTELNSEIVEFKDGLKDGKEGISNNVDKSEKYLGLNPVLLEEYEAVESWSKKKVGVDTAFVNLWGNKNTPKDAPIYVIPSADETPLTIEALYDVLTADKNLAGILSDGVTKGSEIENRISKEIKDASGAPITIEAGKSYVIKIYLGIESVKFDVVVTEWEDGVDGDAELPSNPARN